MKNISCNTGGIWTLVDNVDLVAEMSSYYKLFALELDREGIATWVEPYKFFSRDVLGTTVSVPVYYRNIEMFNLPNMLLGGELNEFLCDFIVINSILTLIKQFCLVAAIDIYMADIEQILGDDDGTTWLKEWIDAKEYFTVKQNSDSVKTLDECELDALRFQSGGESAVCGRCNNANYKYLLNLIPKTCDHKFDSLDSLWNNTDCEYTNVLIMTPSPLNQH